MMPAARRYYIIKRLNMFKDVRGADKQAKFQLRRQKTRFVNEYLRVDGVFILRMLGVVTSEQLANELLLGLWTKKTQDQQEKYPTVTADPIDSSEAIVEKKPDADEEKETDTNSLKLKDKSRKRSRGLSSFSAASSSSILAKSSTLVNNANELLNLNVDANLPYVSRWQLRAEAKADDNSSTTSSSNSNNRSKWKSSNRKKASKAPKLYNL